MSKASDNQPKSIATFIGIPTGVLAVVGGVIGLVTGGPIAALGIAMIAGGGAGMLASVLAFAVKPEGETASETPGRMITAAICGAACLGMNYTGNQLVTAEQTVRDVFQQTAEAALSGASAQNLTSASPAPVMMMNARQDRPMSA